MAITRDIARLAVASNGLSFIEVDWDYDDVNAVGVRVHGVRIVNQTTDLVYGLNVYGNDKGTQRNLLFSGEYQPGTDTGMVPVGPLAVRGGGFNFSFQALRYAP